MKAPIYCPTLLFRLIRDFIALPFPCPHGARNMTPVRPRLTRYIGAIVLVLVIVLVGTQHRSILSSGEYFPRINPFSTSKCPDELACLPKARYLSPKELLSRPFPLDQPWNASIPKIIHQSWSSKELPARFQRWSDTWRTYH